MRSNRGSDARDGFSAEQYSTAAVDYSFVVEHGTATSHWQNANYMLGWCRFKESQLDSASTASSSS
jgi:hypothetical protein